MTSVGNKVKYTGNLDRYREKTDPSNVFCVTYTGKEGKVIDGPYSLPNVPGVEFVDVVWKNEPKSSQKPFLNEKKGHVVNIENLKVIE